MTLIQKIFGIMAREKSRTEKPQSEIKIPILRDSETENLEKKAINYVNHLIEIGKPSFKTGYLKNYDGLIIGESNIVPRIRKINNLQNGLFAIELLVESIETYYKSGNKKLEPRLSEKRTIVFDSKAEREIVNLNTTKDEEVSIENIVNEKDSLIHITCEFEHYHNKRHGIAIKYDFEKRKVDKIEAYREFQGRKTYFPPRDYHFYGVY